MTECDFVIDCGFAVGPMNQANMELLQSALTQGKTVFTLREGGLPSLTESDHNRSIRCDDAIGLLDALDRFSARHTLHPKALEA